MPKLYYVRTETGEDGTLYPTLKQAQDEFDWWISDGSEPEGVHSVSYRNTRQSVADLVNLFRQSTDNEP